MTSQIQFYVSEVDSIGGVTTWSFQAASFLASQFETQVFALKATERESPNTHLFPGSVMQVRTHLERRNASNVDDLVTGEERNETCSAPRAKSTLPTKRPNPSKPRKPSARGPLHPTAEKAMGQAALFIPNYLDFAYQLAARSRVAGIASRCLGICHCDQWHYYRQLVQYAPIIHSFIAVSQRCMEKLIECLPERTADIHLVPYGVGPPLDCATTCCDGPIRLLYAGRLEQKQKRIFDLVEIVRELENRGIDYMLDIVGAGPDCEALVTAFAGAPRVRFHPALSHNEMGQVYRDHDVFLLPSKMEGTSIALLESMAHGLVPVATRVSGSEDVIVDGSNGFLCEVADIRRMADRVAALASKESLLTEIARRAQESVAGSYRIDVQLAAFERCVLEALDKPLVPSEVALSVLRADKSREVG